MRQRVRFGLGLGILLVLGALVIWQGSFSVGDYAPSTPEQTYVFWALSTLTFVLTVLLGFMLFRDAVKLYFARRAGVEGSRIRTKILVGALSLTFLPTLFLVIWSVEVLNRTLDKWFSRPAANIKLNLQQTGSALEEAAVRHGEVLAHWVADSEPLGEFLRSGHVPSEFFASVCVGGEVEEAYIRRADGGRIAVCQGSSVSSRGGRLTSRAALRGGGEVVVRTVVPLDLAAQQAELERHVKDYDRLSAAKRETWRFYLQLLLLITVFVLFVATWVALFLARQISAPVTALLEAARAVRQGDLSHRVRVDATDELATLVRAFNEMTADLETNRAELEVRRKFIEAVLESIPTGVISLGPDGVIRLVNSALGAIFPRAVVRPGMRLIELLPHEQQAEFPRLLKRARRTGVADRQIEVDTEEGRRHFSITIAALEARPTSGYVLVIEDTTELLRAQKAAAWHEVARRIAHELKNPLTPIALSSERILRQLSRSEAPPEVRRIIGECCATIGREVESVKSLVDEFSSLARFPAARLAPACLNDVVAEALAVFEGRLDGIEIVRDLSRGLPLLALDREQLKRAIVNLVDNAAEAMTESPLRQLYIATHAGTPDTVELVIADSGCGIRPADKEKLFLPYFSTKQRGTGLGLAIVSHIVADHHAHIRVEDNQPSGSRFIIELPVGGLGESESTQSEVSA